MLITRKNSFLFFLFFRALRDVLTEKGSSATCKLELCKPKTNYEHFLNKKWDER